MPQVQDEARRIINERGVESISLTQLIQEVTPFARQNVPNEVKREVLLVLKKFIEEQSGVEI